MARFSYNQRYLDANGDPLAGGKLYFYESGTTTPKTTYSEVSQTTPNTNPVILDAGGLMSDVFFTGSVKLVIKDADDVQINVIDPVGGDTLSAAEVASLYESNDDVNRYTDAEKTKLGGIDESANDYTHPNHSGDVTSVADGAQTIASTAITGKTTITDVADDDEVLVSDTSDSGNLKSAAVSSVRQNDWSYTGLASGEYIGPTMTVPDSVLVTKYDAVYIDATGAARQFSNSSASTASIVGVALETKNAAPVLVMVTGVIRDTSFSWNEGAPIYGSPTGTPGLSETQVATGWGARAAIALDSDIILVSPTEAVDFT